MTAVQSDAAALLGVYARVGPLFVAGEGSELIAEDGTRYLDFVAGIAVNALGYNSPVIREAIVRALDTGLVHASNLYRTDPGERLAAELTKTFGGQVFFCNSGAEANEGAFKFARKWSGKTEIVAFSGSFHGRLFASLAATDRPDYRRPFEPLLAGVQIIPLGDRAAAARAVTDATAAVIIEPLQGEGGVRPVEPAFLAFLRDLCDERGAALIFDEVQCGLGRTGTLFAYEQAGVTPDLLTLAKPLAGGLPMGAVLVGDRVAAGRDRGARGPAHDRRSRLPRGRAGEGCVARRATGAARRELVPRARGARARADVGHRARRARGAGRDGGAGTAAARPHRRAERDPHRAAADDQPGRPGARGRRTL